MKLNGQTIDLPNVCYAVIPRSTPSGDPQDIVFHAKAVLDYDACDSLHPEPRPPKAQRPGGEVFEDVEDPKYKAKWVIWAQARRHWLILDSLAATPGLEWSTIKLNEPATWGNYMQELKDAKFSIKEVNLILGAVFEANGLDDDKLEQARKRFLESLLDKSKVTP